MSQYLLITCYVPSTSRSCSCSNEYRELVPTCITVLLLFFLCPNSHSSKSYYPSFPSYNMKVLVDIDKWERSWRKWYWGERQSLWGSVGTSAQPGKMPWTSEDPTYLNCWDNVIVNVLVNVNSIYLIVLVCGRKEGVWKNSLIITVNISVLYILCICKIW